ncbi:MAG TPA: hypothetical protein VH866_10205 [Candidatus Deferrimicrobiaceae bacterium]|jgi:hypothetical protein
MTMKTGLFAVALAICLLAGAMSGAALAGDARVAGWGYSSSADPERELADFNSWRIQDPIETGAVPDASSGSHMGSMSSSDEAAFPVVEFGGVQYRIGLDTAS